MRFLPEINNCDNNSMSSIFIQILFYFESFNNYWILKRIDSKSFLQNCQVITTL